MNNFMLKHYARIGAQVELQRAQKDEKIILAFQRIVMRTDGHPDQDAVEGYVAHRLNEANSTVVECENFLRPV